MPQKKHHSSLKRNILLSAALFLMFVSSACSKYDQYPTKIIEVSNPPSTSASTPATVPPEQPSSSPAAPSSPATYKMVPLAWESAQYPQRTLWSEHLQKIILENWNSLLPGADDILNFCPRYNVLNNDERANVWAQLFVAMAKYESAYNPLSRMQETTMGTDPITGKPVYSEGLLQLSYQDIQWAPWCAFDWSKDKSLSPTDPNKTVLDPFLNLDCGVGIMAQQIKNKGKIVVSSGVYWAVIKYGGTYNKITEIQSMVKSLSLCK
ncbi:MAG: hypothetical protein ACXVCL_19215 [Bdellovibrio sp.]